MLKLKLRAIAAALSLLATVAHAAPSYTFVDLGTLGGRSSVANDINDLRQVVGSSGFSLDTGNVHAALWSNGTVTDLSVLANNATGAAYAINNAGQIAGVTDHQAPNRATLWDNGKVVYLGPAGTSVSPAFDINNQGQVVGYSTNPATGNSEATLWNGSQPGAGTFGPAGAYGSSANAINNHGDVIGYRSETDATKTFIWSGGQTTDLPASFNPNAINDQRQAVGSVTYLDGDEIAARPVLWSGNTLYNLATLGGRSSAAQDINNSGMAVGASVPVGGYYDTHATLWADGTVYDLNDFLDPAARDAGWILTGANAINGLGDIVGTATLGPYGDTRAFLLLNSGTLLGSAVPAAPVPEPETYAMVLASLGMFAVLRRRAGKRAARRG